MKAFEFQGSVNPDRTIAVPAPLADQIPSQLPVRVIVLVDEDDDEERDWARLTSEHFLQGYDASDSIYDNL